MPLEHTSFIEGPNQMSTNMGTELKYIYMHINKLVVMHRLSRKYTFRLGLNLSNKILYLSRKYMYKNQTLENKMFVFNPLIHQEKLKLRMSQFNNVLLLFVVLGALVDTPWAYLLPSDDFSVAVENDISGEDITVHCKSGDDDLGPHVLKTWEIFHWNFHGNFGGTTLYFCHVTTQDKSTRFDAFKYSKDRQRCSPKCTWKVQKSGILGFNKNDKNDVTINWP